MNENLENTVVEAGEVETTSTTEKTYTQAEVEEMLQREADRRVSQALKKAEKKNADRVREAQKLAQMNEQEKYIYELEQREKAIAEKEKALALAENKNEASKILSEKGISLSLVDFVVAEDAETMKANITLLDKAFRASVKAEVEKRLGSGAPKKNLPLDEAISKDNFFRMSLLQQQQLKNENPDLYASLVK